MKHNDFYPRRKPERPGWHTHFAAKVQQYAATLGLTTEEVNNAVADNLTLAYGLGVWISNVRDFAPSCTSALEKLTAGVPGAPFIFTPYTAPALPALPVGADPVEPGALTRTFDLVQTIKRKPGYTNDIGIDMGIVGSEEPPPPPGDDPTPRLRVTAVQGIGQENGQVKFYKDGHTGIWLESRRGGAWEFLATTDKSPYIDARPLLVPGQAEIREYRARFWDKGQPNGDWCDVAKITVSP